MIWGSAYYGAFWAEESLTTAAIIYSEVCRRDLEDNNTL